jgi:hypothetical protein
MGVVLLIAGATVVTENQIWGCHGFGRPWHNNRQKTTGKSNFYRLLRPAWILATKKRPEIHSMENNSPSMAELMGISLKKKARFDDKQRHIVKFL